MASPATAEGWQPHSESGRRGNGRGRGGEMWFPSGRRGGGRWVSVEKEIGDERQTVKLAQRRERGRDGERQRKTRCAHCLCVSWSFVILPTGTQWHWQLSLGTNSRTYARIYLTNVMCFYCQLLYKTFVIIKLSTGDNNIFIIYSIYPEKEGKEVAQYHDLEEESQPLLNKCLHSVQNHTSYNLWHKYELLVTHWFKTARGFTGYGSVDSILPRKLKQLTHITWNQILNLKDPNFDFVLISIPRSVKWNLVPLCWAKLNGVSS